MRLPSWTSPCGAWIWIERINGDGVEEFAVKLDDVEIYRGSRDRAIATGHKTFIQLVEDWDERCE